MDYKELISNVKKLQQRVDGLYVYGAGFYGQDIFRTLKRHGVNVNGFLVTKDISHSFVLNKPVYLAEQVINQNIGIVLGLSDIYTAEVVNYLKSNNFNMQNTINGGKFITVSSGRLDMRKSKFLEISTIMGCSVNCKYCPQSTLLKAYYKSNKNRQRVMTIDNFEKILENTPNDCVINFAAMTEPFNNPDCYKMMEMACAANRTVFLFSTLADVDEETIDKIIKLPIEHMTLHTADKFGYAHIHTTETYYRNIEKVINAKKRDGSPFVNYISAQAEPDKRIQEIVNGKCEIMYSLHDRAGNLSADGTEHRTEIIGAGNKIKCCCFGDDLSDNVVLPDGTMILCGSDYGMRHVLGNLYEEDYESIRGKGELQRVLKEMDGGSDMNLLCRSCLLARIIK